MPQRKINVAIVGLGFGKEFIPIYQHHPQANMYAICQRTQARLNEVGDQFGVEKRYSDFEALLCDPEVDAIHINSPIHLHASQSIAALNAGKHVACTVPAATTVEECTEIVHAAERNRKNYMMMETSIYTREFLFIRGNSGESSSCAGATSRKWRDGRATGKDFRPCTMPPTP